MWIYNEWVTGIPTVFNEMLNQTGNPNVYHGARIHLYNWLLLHLELRRISKYKECIWTIISFQVNFMDIEGDELKGKMSGFCNNNFAPTCWTQIAVIRSYFSGRLLFSIISVHTYLCWKNFVSKPLNSSFFQKAIF